MNKFQMKRRFRQRDLLPRGLALAWAQVDYGFAELQLLTESGKPMTVDQLVRHSELLDIRQQATEVLLDWNVPAAEWGEMPPLPVTQWNFDADNECQGR